MATYKQSRQRSPRRWVYLLIILAAGSALVGSAFFYGADKGAPDGDLLGSVNEAGLGQGDPLLELSPGTYRVVGFHKGVKWTDLWLEREDNSQFPRYYSLRTDLIHFDTTSPVAYPKLVFLKGKYHQKITLFLDP